VFSEISKRVPKDLDVGLEELAIDKQTIRLRVEAKSFEAADRLGTELAKFGPFEQAQIGAIETDNRTGGKKFNVTISLASDMAARESAPEREPAAARPAPERPAPAQPAAPAPAEAPSE
jgi:Tfp pilus assembly protein PilN